MAKIIRGNVSRRDLVKGGASLAASASFLRAGTARAQEVPRNRQLIVRSGGEGGRFPAPAVWNGYASGATFETGLGLLNEPLAYYVPFSDQFYPWLSEGWGYSPDNMGLQILIRRGVTWSDGTPFSADDVAFTINALRDVGTGVEASVYVAPLVEEAVASNPGEVLVKFKIPAARFMFDLFVYAFDRGWPILPKHIFEGQDLATFGKVDPVTTGPWQVVESTAGQVVLDRSDSWWAVDQGLVGALPAVERIVVLPWSDEDSVAKQLVGDEIDSSRELRPQTIATIQGQNPRVTTFTGTRPPLGSVGGDPIALYVNCEKEAFADPAVRWALSSFIDRQGLIDDALDGAGTMSELPMPPFAGLRMYIEGVAELLQQYPTTEFDPGNGAGLLMDAGWTKQGESWTKAGQALTVPIVGSEQMADLGQAVAAQLVAQGIEASFSVTDDLVTRLNAGDYDAALLGQSGSYSGDPYYTAALYQMRSEAVPGGRPVNISRWQNVAYDALVEEMARTAIDHEPQADPEKLLDLWQQAMAIWLPELPSIQLLESDDRVPMNRTYWAGWPTSGDPVSSGAFTDRSFQLVLNQLRSAQ